MLKYISKLAMDILPSVAATIIGAYIVNHYITAKPAANAPIAAAVSPANPKKPDPASADVANIPAAGVRAKGIKALFEKSTPEKSASEKSASEKSSSEKSASEKSVAEKPREKAAEKSAEKSVEQSEDKPAETASIPAETKRQPAASREKSAIRTIPLTVQPAASVVAPTVVPANPPPAIEADRDANDLARAAIERLRASNGGSPRTEAPRVVAPAPQAFPQQASVPQGPNPMVRPLPPPIMVSAPPSEESYGSGPSPAQPNSVAARNDDPGRPVPPADIPSARPLDLRAQQPADPSAQEHHNVAEDMLLAAKSMFHAVVPQ
jgi:hypothetical protein